jgi:serine/threonine protein kinase
LVGKGGHAEVYKGKLSDGQVVAVKRLMNDDKDFADRAGDFLAELGIIAHINHPNATRLVGFGIDRGLYFVLQLAQHGSLSSLLFGAQRCFCHLFLGFLAPFVLFDIASANTILFNMLC